MNKEKEINFDLRILGIDVKKFSQFELTKEFDKKKFPLVQYQTNLSFRVDNDNEKIVCIVQVSIRLVETEELFAELIVETSFLVSPLKKLVKLNDDGKESINTVVMYNLASVSVSTIRGILFERLKGSLIQNEIYPLTDLAKMFNLKK